MKPAALFWGRARKLLVAVAVVLMLVPVLAAPFAVWGVSAVVASIPNAATSCLAATQGAQQGEDTVVFPLPAGTWTVTSPFGMRMHPVKHVWAMHNGTDFGAADGTPILAVMDGVVSDIVYPVSGDNYIEVESTASNGQAIRTIYMHVWQTGILVSRGQPVAAGDVIGTVGNAGTSTGAHLHLETWIDGERVDPWIFLAERGALEVADCELLQL